MPDYAALDAGVLEKVVMDRDEWKQRALDAEGDARSLRIELDVARALCNGLGCGKCESCVKAAEAKLAAAEKALAEERERADDLKAQLTDALRDDPDDQKKWIIYWRKRAAKAKRAAEAEVARLRDLLCAECASVDRTTALSPAPSPAPENEVTCRCGRWQPPGSICCLPNGPTKPPPAPAAEPRDEERCVVALCQHRDWPEKGSQVFYKGTPHRLCAGHYWLWGQWQRTSGAKTFSEWLSAQAYFQLPEPLTMTALRVKYPHGLPPEPRLREPGLLTREEVERVRACLMGDDGCCAMARRYPADDAPHGHFPGCPSGPAVALLDAALTRPG